MDERQEQHRKNTVMVNMAEFRRLHITNERSATAVCSVKLLN